MRYKLETPLSARLLNGQFFRRFRPATRLESRPAVLNEMGAIYGATLRRDAFFNRREIQR